MNHQLTYGITKRWEIDAIPFPLVINDNSREIDGPKIGLGDAMAWSRFLLYEQTHEEKYIPSLLLYTQLKLPTGIVDLHDATGRRTYGNLMTETTVGFAEFIDARTFMIVSFSLTLYGINTYQNWGPYLSAGRTFF